MIAVDGKPARPFRVGGMIEEGLVLQSASARQATLGQSRDGPVLVTLDMPSLSKEPKAARPVLCMAQRHRVVTACDRHCVKYKHCG